MKTFLTAKWQNIVMANYEVEAKLLLPYLPFGVELDTFDNKIFISLVGFRFIESSIFGIPIPFYGSFDEVNLRFYVTRKEGLEVRRGVVFIREIVPYKIVAFLANALYKEHYISSEMRHKTDLNSNEKLLEYYWRYKEENYFIKATCNNVPQDIEAHSLEEFIFEHYYGYTKVHDNETWGYKVNHPRWQVHEVKRFDIRCNFGKMYGSDFTFLNHLQPHTVYTAIGSEITIDWKVKKLRNKS